MFLLWVGWIALGSASCISLDPSITICCLTIQVTTMLNKQFKAPRGPRRALSSQSCTCFSLYLGGSFLSFLPGLRALGSLFSSLSHPPWYKSLGGFFNTLCMVLSLLPCHCLLRACRMFRVCPWGVMGSRMVTVDLIALVLRQCLTHRASQWIFAERQEGFLAHQSAHVGKQNVLENSMNSSWVILINSCRQRHSSIDLYFSFKAHS